MVDEEAPVKWQVSGMLMAIETIGERRGAVMVYPDTGFILALETTLQPSGDALRDVEQVFENHAHKVIGRHRNIMQAMAVAEQWLREWAWAHRTTMDGKCECPEINSTSAI